MENIADGFSSLSTPNMDGSVDPAALGLPPTWVVDLTAATHSDIEVEEIARQARP